MNVYQKLDGPHSELFSADKAYSPREPRFHEFAFKKRFRMPSRAATPRGHRKLPKH
jgi:hypothetical protein